jgi:hypothetical protein
MRDVRALDNVSFEVRRGREGRGTGGRAVVVASASDMLIRDHSRIHHTAKG